MAAKAAGGKITGIGLKIMEPKLIVLTLSIIRMSFSRPIMSAGSKIVQKSQDLSIMATLQASMT
jgi:hypothetical protein